MKCILLPCLLIFTLKNITAQTLTEGFFQYHIEVEAIDTAAQTRMTVNLLKDSQMILFFAPQRSRMDFKMGQIGLKTIVVDKQKDILLTLSSNSEEKNALMTKHSALKPTIKDSVVGKQFFKGDSIIMGLNCKRVITLTQSGIYTEYWYTNDFTVESEDDQIVNSDIPGFPVMFSKVEKGVKMTFQLSNMKKELDLPYEKIFFTIPPEGFKMVNSIQ